MRELILPPVLTGRHAAGLLVLRLAVGAAFVLHGWPKIQNPTGWMTGMDGAPPGPMQALAAVAEFGGGLALILGALTPLACLGLLGTMAGAMLYFHLPKGTEYIAAPGKPSYELVVVYAAAAFTLLMTGPGAISVDALLLRRAKQPAVAAT